MIIDTHIHIIVKEITKEFTNNSQSPQLQNDQGNIKLKFNNKILNSVLFDFIDLDNILTQQRKHGYIKFVLSPWSSLFHYDLDLKYALETNRIQNNALSKIAREYQNHLIALGMVPLQDIDASISELNYCMDQGLKGVEIGTNVNGKYLGEEIFRPFWSEVEKLGAVVQIHPVPGIGGPTNRQFYLWNAFANPAETALTASHMILSGLLEEYPNLKIQLFHGGGYLPYQIGRLDHAFEVRTESSSRISRKPSEYLKLFYFDTIVHSIEALEYLINLVGIDKVMVGSDYPFDMGQYQPKNLIDNLNLKVEQKNKILYQNAEKLFGI